ncbi:hypothetical protein Y695_02587 [Hydrogenophaga sp. T4]|nr:hypothetical protein Y695_02587 [Hydrogenophaga sp. T4]
MTSTRTGIASWGILMPWVVMVSLMAAEMLALSQALAASFSASVASAG